MDSIGAPSTTEDVEATDTYQSSHPSSPHPIMGETAAASASNETDIYFDSFDSPELVDSESADGEEGFFVEGEGMGSLGENVNGMTQETGELQLPPLRPTESTQQSQPAHEEEWETMQDSASDDEGGDIDMGLPFSESFFEDSWDPGVMSPSVDSTAATNGGIVASVESVSLPDPFSGNVDFGFGPESEDEEDDDGDEDDDDSNEGPVIGEITTGVVDVVGPAWWPTLSTPSSQFYSLHGMAAPLPQLFFSGEFSGGFMPPMDNDGENDQVEFDADGITIVPGDIEADDADFTRFMSKLYFRYNAHHSIPNDALNARDGQGIWRDRPAIITARMMKDNGWDSQAIPWDKLGITREDARKIRKLDYKNFSHHRRIAEVGDLLPNDLRLFDFVSVDSNQKCRPIHFQLRNLLAATSSNDVFYANESVVKHTNPRTGRTREILNLTSTARSHFRNSYRITTMTASQDVLLVGDYCGMYAMKSLSASHTAPHIQGAITESEIGITNHVHIHPSRHTGSPIAVFCSNDSSIRQLDCLTNTFSRPHFFDNPVNCAATSPCTRLRAVVGDMKEVMIVEADSGRIVRQLKGHQDYGFAAAWSDDGIHIATGNQDKTVRVYDARKTLEPIRILKAEIAGVRALRFSATGDGPKVLAMTEPTDFVHMVDAHNGLFDREQRWDCFGEIGGLDFTPGGEELFVANTDKWFGGLVRFKRYAGAERGKGRKWDEDEGERRRWRLGRGIVGVEDMEEEEEDVLMMGC